MEIQGRPQKLYFEGLGGEVYDRINSIFYGFLLGRSKEIKKDGAKKASLELLAICDDRGKFNLPKNRKKLKIIDTYYPRSQVFVSRQEGIIHSIIYSSRSQSHAIFTYEEYVKMGRPEVITERKSYVVSKQ